MNISTNIDTTSGAADTGDSSGVAGRRRVLVVVDPVQCGTSAVERALAELDPDTDELVVLVVATPPRPGAPIESAYVSETHGGTGSFRRAESFLRTALGRAHSAGFRASGWVAPPRRIQLMNEIGATAPYDLAFAISPRGGRFGLRRRDLAGLLAGAGVPAELRCLA